MTKFKFQVLWRLIVICGLILLLFFLIQYKPLLLLLFITALAIVAQVINLFHYLNKTNRELSRFLQSILNADFTQSFSFGKLGPSFFELNQAFRQVQKQIFKLRTEKEEQYRYLNTVVRHAGVGLISFKYNGQIEFINNAAKQILQVSALKTIKSLKNQRPVLVNAMQRLRAGENTTVKIKIDGKTMTLSVHVTQFSLHGESFTLASIQNIQSEIEREKMANELEIARKVQQSLLPGENPQIKGFDVSGFSLPAKEVGGDYYDVIPLNKDKLVLIVGDVSGKGISAAFYMTLIKGFIMVLIKKNLTPKQILVELNDYLISTLEKKIFVTIFLAVLDRQEEKLICARAGHNPALFYSAKEHSISLIKPGGIALGFRTSQEFSKSLEEKEICFFCDDWFIIYSDGVVEARNRDMDEFGDQRFIDTVMHNTNHNSQTLLKNLFKEVERFTGTPTGPGKSPVDQHDDMTVLAVKFT